MEGFVGIVFWSCWAPHVWGSGAQMEGQITTTCCVLNSFLLLHLPWHLELTPAPSDPQAFCSLAPDLPLLILQRPDAPSNPPG